jgi:hypothetical protein
VLAELVEQTVTKSLKPGAQADQSIAKAKLPKGYLPPALRNSRKQSI